MALLDQFGNPIPEAALKKPAIAGPTLLGDRPAITTLNMAWISPDAVSSMLNAADSGNSQAWQELCTLIEQKDLHYLGVLTTRKNTIAQLPITVLEAGSDSQQEKQAEFVRHWLKREILRKSLFDMLDAIAKGWSVTAIKWHAEAGNYWPAQLIYRPQRWFEVSAQDGETIMLRNSRETATLPDMPDARPEISFSNIPPYSAVIHRHPSWSGLTINSGLTRAIIFNALFKLYSLRDWGIFVQAYGMPIRLGKFGPDSSAEDRRVLFKAVNDIAGRGAGIIPKSMEILFVEPKNGAGSNDVYERRAKYLDEQTSKAVLGQTGTTDTKQGAHASALIHRQVQEDIERKDALLLSYTVNEQLIRPMIDFTFGPPPDGLYPTVMIGRPDEVDVPTLITAVKDLGPQGFKVLADDLYARLNLTPPQEGDTIVGVTAQAQAPQPAQIKAPQTRPGAVNPSLVPAPKKNSPPEAQETLTEDKELTLNAQQLEHVADDPDTRLINALCSSLAKEATTPLLDPVQSAFEGASNLEAFERVLEEISLEDQAFGEAMANGMLAANLAGRVRVGQMMAQKIREDKAHAKGQ